MQILGVADMFPRLGAQAGRLRRGGPDVRAPRGSSLGLSVLSTMPTLERLPASLPQGDGNVVVPTTESGFSAFIDVGLRLRREIRGGVARLRRATPPKKVVLRGPAPPAPQVSWLT